MEPQCVYQNRACVNCGLGEWPIIEVIKPAEDFRMEVGHMLILYVKRGRVDVTYGMTDNYPLTQGDIMLFPPGIRLDIKIVEEGLEMMMIKIMSRITLCDKYVFGDLTNYIINVDELRHSHLEATPMIRSFMEVLADNLSGRLRCYKYMELKIMELFHYLRAYYSSDELAEFSQPLLSPNAQFMYFIWSNHRAVRNVADFAKLANCSLSAFKLKFRHVTGTSPSQWLNKQRAQNVFHEIATGEKSLKEISEEYHFSSVSHLGTFCRKNFGKSPGMLKPDKEFPEKKVRKVREEVA